MIAKQANLDLVETQLAEDGLNPPERKLQEIDLVIFDTGKNIRAQACMIWLFEYFPNIPFILISSQDGWMRLCNQREVLIREPEDLLGMGQAFAAIRQSVGKNPVHAFDLSIETLHQRLDSMLRQAERVAPDPSIELHGPPLQFRWERSPDARGACTE